MAGKRRRHGVAGNEIRLFVDPRRLNRLFVLLRKHGVSRFVGPDLTVEFSPPAAPPKEAPPEPPARRLDPKDTKSVDAFLKARLNPAGGSN